MSDTAYHLLTFWFVAALFLAPFGVGFALENNHGPRRAAVNVVIAFLWPVTLAGAILYAVAFIACSLATNRWVGPGALWRERRAVPAPDPVEAEAMREVEAMLTREAA